MSEVAGVVNAEGAAGQPVQPVGQGLPPQAIGTGAGEEEQEAYEPVRADGTATPQAQGAPPGGGARAAGVGGERQGGAEGWGRPPST